MNTAKIKSAIRNHFNLNEDLKEEMDYLPDSERYKIYTEQVNQLTDREALEQLYASLEPSELVDFIEALERDYVRNKIREFINMELN